MEFLQHNWHWAALAVFSGSLLAFDLIRNKGTAGTLSPLQATMLINREDAVIVDVRSAAEFATGHIAGARNIPLSDLSQRSAELEKLKDRPLILCCQSGARSGSALSKLRGMGFEKLFNLQGGIAEWQKAGQPIKRKK